MPNSLMFFNKEGYPHNFQYNEQTESYEGKILFDENSSDVFKTQSLHIFEDVPPIEFSVDDASFMKLNYFNISGMTITGEVGYTNETITNILKINESDQFYSKWIYGQDFHKKFSKGTIITFTGVTGSGTLGLTDYVENKYFTVLDIKKNAVMIITDTSNDQYNLNFTSGYIKESLNVISINDYNRGLSNDIFFQELYDSKKLSIINSDYNNNIVSVKYSGVNYSYLNQIKLNGSAGKVFTLSVQFFTERPKLFQGNANLFRRNGITYIYLGKVPSSFYPETIYNPDGSTSYAPKEIIFQDYTGGTLFNGRLFNVEGVVDSLYIGQKDLKFKVYSQILNSSTNARYKMDTSGIVKSIKWNAIIYDGFLDINKGDIIHLSGLSNSCFNNNRDFSLSNVTYNSSNNKTTMITPDYIIPESGFTYNITKKLKPYQIRTIQVKPTIPVAEGSSKWEIDTNCFLTSTVLNFSAIYQSGSTNEIAKTNTIDAFSKKHKSTLNQYGINIYQTPNSTDTLSVESLYESKHQYFTVSGFTNGVKINDNFTLSETNNGLTKRYDIITNESLTGETTNRSTLTKLSKNATAEIGLKLYYDIPISGKTLGFRLTINSIEYYAQFVNNTQTTINTFIDNFGTILYGNGFNVYSGYSSNYTGYTLNIKTITPELDIWDLEIMVNLLSSYQIIEHQRNRGIMLAGNEIRSNYSFFDIGLATGMILKISGNTYAENNKEYNIIGLTDHSISLSYQGAFLSGTSMFMLGKTREFIRKPRGEYNRDIYYRVYWEIPYSEAVDESIFLYDITGSQLKPYNNIENLRYVGPTPLINSTNNPVFLNKEPNKDMNRISNPKYQQTVFDELNFKLEQLDSALSYNWIPEPLEIFVGYNTPNEGVNHRIMKIEKIEKIENTDTLFSYTGYTISGNSFKNFTFNNDTLTYGLPDINFVSYGFEKDQLIKFEFQDQSKKNQIIFENIATYKILNVFRNKIIIETGITSSTPEFTSGFTYFSTTGATFKFKIEVQPKEILSCVFYGQTEIEDMRFGINLNNVGVQLDDDVYTILYKSDISDNAIDYTLLNQKRKEMLTTFREIYDYIGSYKSLINAINFFGYNDLQLYEYYQNVDQSSPLYAKLHKVLIPDIFDNTVEGWHEMDFIAGKYQNQTTWKKSNLFNLAYRITDEEGNNVLIYTLEEVQYKLTKLKKWLRKNIIPISANLTDITGVADGNQTLYQEYDESNQTTKSVVERNCTVVNFNYTSSLNFGSDYLITVNFYTLSGTSFDYNEIPESFTAKIKTFFLSGSTMIPVQYHKIIKNDLEPYSFNLDKYQDPYIYIETTTYGNDGAGAGFVNNKLFYFDEPRNHWLVDHNFDMTKYKFIQPVNYIDQNGQYNAEGQVISYEEYVKALAANNKKASTVVGGTGTETIVVANTLNKTYTSNILNI